ncbi:MAG: hypothetical protein K0S86_4443, partial [Geminicoccaceae bacterium]|nr:hypothetical protein [Geminicoccaceae bacterium]
ASSGATIAAAARTARLGHAHARATSIDGTRFGLAPAGPNGVTSLERLRSGVFHGVPGNRPGSAEEVSLLAGRFKPYRTQAGSVWIVRAESAGRVYRAERDRDAGRPAGPSADVSTRQRVLVAVPDLHSHRSLL